MDKIWLKRKLIGKKDTRFGLGIVLSYKTIYYKGESENFKDYTHSYVHIGSHFENGRHGRHLGWIIWSQLIFESLVSLDELCQFEMNRMNRDDLQDKN